MPGFKTAFVKYLAAVESLSYEFVRLVAEALGLARFFDARERMQHRAKVRYAMPAHLITTLRLGREAGHSLARFVFASFARSSSIRPETRSRLSRA